MGIKRNNEEQDAKQKDKKLKKMAEILLISGSYQIVKSIPLFVSQNTWMTFVLRCSEL